jgi:hypothetical protein
VLEKKYFGNPRYLMGKTRGNHDLLWFTVDFPTKSDQNLPCLCPSPGVHGTVVGGYPAALFSMDQSIETSEMGG